MGQLMAHRLDRGTQVRPRMADLVRDWLRDCGLSPKEVALKTNLDLRTVQNAFAGHCALETYGVLLDTFEFDIALPVSERRIGRGQLEAWEARLARHRAEGEAAERRLARLRAAHRAGSALADGGLRLVGELDRAFAPTLGGTAGDLGQTATDGGKLDPKPNGGRK